MVQNGLGRKNKCLKFFGDSELVVNQVRNIHVTKNDVLKMYKHRIWDLIEYFDAFNLLSIPRSQNKETNRLVALGAQFDIPKELENIDRQQYVKFFVRPSVLDNNVNWQVFYSDEQIANFLIEEAEFSTRNQRKFNEQYENHFLQLKTNKLPKGLVTLKSIFNTDNQVRKDKGSMFVKEEYYGPVEIFKDKILKTDKVCTLEEKHAFVKLCQEFNDIFAWRYEDLKGFDPHLAQHTIELVDNSKPLRQKQWPLK